MEGLGGEGERRTAQRPSRATLIRRRGFALAAALLAGAALWLVFGRNGAGERGAQPAPVPDVSEPVAEMTGGLSPEEQVDQVLLVGFEGSGPPLAILDELAARQLGGVLIGPENWAGAGPGTELVERLREAGSSAGRIPPLIATSQEGGRYRSLADLPPEQTELEIGDAASLPAAAEWAGTTAAALAGGGFDLNLAPVADVATLDSAIADRAFSDDPGIAAQLTGAAVRACLAEGIACAPLHFPGLGAASQDTSAGPATVALDPVSLDERDLEPFRAAFVEGAPAVVLSLAIYSAYDPITPGALTEPIATDLLREELGFEGVAITDDLGSGAIRAGSNVEDAAVAALGAGADLVQIAAAEDQTGVRKALLAAVDSGELAPERLAEAASRVLELKTRLGLLGLGEAEGAFSTRPRAGNRAGVQGKE